MDLPTPPSIAVATASRIVLSSRVAYELQSVKRGDATVPRLLGTGRFANVFAAQQIIDGRPGRLVAIKVLHDHMDYPAEQLFAQEITLNRDFVGGSTSGLPPILDVIHLAPLVMCGCGTVYHPNCPNGCGRPLQRVNLKDRPYPGLRCDRCDYLLSAEFVRDRQGAALYSANAKPCCNSEVYPHANGGTIVNFVLREAMVMELMSESLASYSAFTDDKERQPSPPPDGLERLFGFYGLVDATTRQARVGQKTRLLARVDLMVKIAETVVRLHEQLGVVHRDIAPDNIMIGHTPCGAPGEFKDEPVTNLLDGAANLCVQPCVIDFGLADRIELSRSWYEEGDLRGSIDKLPYMSPEARLQRQSIGAIEFDHERGRFRVPAALLQSPASIAVNDIIADCHDTTRGQDVKVTKIEKEGAQWFAYFEGVAPRDRGRHFEIVRPLGEAHDVYALGAVFCYILTGRHDEVENLSNLVRSIQEQPCPLYAGHLAERDNYSNRIRAMREPYWRDRLMEVILRAMVRGRPESFAPNRTIRGPTPVRRLLRELKRIQQGLMAEVFAEHEYATTRRRRRWVTLAFAAVVVLYAGFPSMSALRGWVA
jgi:serine/threonine protein kinase